MRQRRKVMGYREALRWILEEDDTSFLDDEEPIASVTVVFLASIYDRETDEVVRDLLQLRKRIE